ncbi:MAG TPA: hypothetical protein VNR41_05360 [Xanthobacteraceae bacterium]|jgi:hypothetical protein|nr:hypothetical protein [Xanthobacteraceae bacterium]
MSILFRIFLALAFMSPALALAQAPKKAVASPALQAEFDKFIASFRKGSRRTMQGPSPA